MRVLHPMGFDAFGLPAENAAIREGGHPREITERNIVGIRASMKRIGWGYDWSRELSTHDPRYYRWQQWQFLRFLERGLAYRKGAPVKWCPNDQTVLANEQVLADGTCERCGALVESRVMEQWFFRITDYAQALLDDLDTVDWPGVDQGAPAQLDRPLRGRRDRLPDRRVGRGRHRLHDPAGHALRRDVLRPRARARARRADRVGRGAGVRAPCGCEEDGGARGGGREDRRLHRAACGQPGQRRADPRLRRRLRPHRLRHRRDHGRPGARPARLRLRARVRPAGARQVVRPPEGDVDEASRTSSTREGEVLVNSGEFDGLPAPEGGTPDRREARRARAAATSRSTSACATGASRASGTGAARSRSSTATPAGSSRCPTRSCRSCCPEVEDYKPKGRPPLAQAEEWVRATCPTCGGRGAPRDRDDGHVRRLVLVLPALLRPRTRRGARSSARSSTTGTRSTSTSAASTTRRCT